MKVILVDRFESETDDGDDDVVLLVDLWYTEAGTAPNG